MPDVRETGVIPAPAIAIGSAASGDHGIESTRQRSGENVVSRFARGSASVVPPDARRIGHQLEQHRARRRCDALLSRLIEKLIPGATRKLGHGPLEKDSPAIVLRVALIPF